MFSSQIFPIDEPPSHTNLRVKLVSLKHAKDYTTSLSHEDILQLGLSMCAVAIGSNECTPDSYTRSGRQHLQSYDVSLMLLVDWMLDSDTEKRATIADVIRHPYFMGIHETEAFAMALHGGLFKGLVSAEQFDQNALKPMSNVLRSEIAVIFDVLKGVPEANDEDEDGDEDADCDDVCSECRCVAHSHVRLSLR